MMSEKYGSDDNEYVYLSYIKWTVNNCQKYIIIQFSKAAPTKQDFKNGFTGVHLEFCGQGCSAYNAIKSISVNDMSIFIKISDNKIEDIETPLIEIPLAEFSVHDIGQIISLFKKFVRLDGDAIPLSIQRNV